MQFEYYVMNYDFNKRQMERWNIFNNYYIQKWTEKAVKKYIRSPKKYKYIKQYENKYLGTEEIAIYGFDALCAEIKMIIAHECRARREYEISVSDAFTYEIRDIVRDLDNFNSLEELKKSLTEIEKKNPKLEKWDVFNQCELNIPMIAREVIYQYRKQKKEKKDEI